MKKINKAINKKAVIFILLFLFSFNFPFLNALEQRGEVEFSIRFFDRQIYYVQTNPIYVQITITNNSPWPYRFKLADDRAFSIDFDIRTMTNRQMPQSELLLRKRTTTNNVYFREISLESGESFSFTENLSEYVTFEQSGSFRVRAFIYPELYRSVQTAVNAAPIETNYLSLTLRPSLLPAYDGIPLEMDTATGAVLVRQQLPPDQIVSYMLTARQQSQWERFFLYLDIETMIQRDAALRRRYLAENETGRRQMAAEYRRNLQLSVVDGDISMIPTSFDILRTVYSVDEGTVTVMQRYRFSNYTQLRQYTYYFKKQNDYWVIVDYSVQGMGTISND